MLGRLVRQSFLRGRRRKALALVSVTLGVGVASGLFGLVTRLGDVVARDLRRFGANIVVSPDTREVPIRFGGVTLSAGSRRLDESDLTKIRGNFWKHNILAFAPYLYAVVREPRSSREFVLAGTWFHREVGGSDFATGVRETAPWWEIDGEWIQDEEGEGTILVGARLALALGVEVGGLLQVEREGRRGSFRISGLVLTGGDEEDRAFARLEEVQALLGEPGAVSQVMVSALTRPEPSHVKPKELMTAEERERFYCTPYPSNIARTIQERIPGSRAEPITARTRAEGDLLRKVEALSLGMGAMAIAGAVLGVIAAMAQAIGARRGEMALMQILGARRSQVLGQLALEGTILGLIGGVLGFILGATLAAAGAVLLGVPLGVPYSIFPLVLLVSTLVVLGGTLPHALRALRAWPVEILRTEGV